MTLSGVAAAPRWAGVLLLTTLVTFVVGALLLRTDVGQLALVDQWERTALAFGGSIDDAGYARLQDLSLRGVPYAALMALVSGPLLVLALASLLLLGSRSLLRAEISFRQLVAIVAHSGVILALRQLVAAPLQFASESLASPTTLNGLFGALDESTPLARLLSSLDLFVVWWIIVLATGVAAAVKRPTRPLALAFAGTYFALAILLTLAMALTGGTA